MKILVIPDCQVKPGVATDHLTWAGEAICDYRPDVVINIGDFADMPSLSTHDKAGSKYFEGKRYKDDIASAQLGMKKLLKPLRDLQATQKINKHKVYKPRMILTMGNHENRINRAVANTPMLEGVISTDDLNYQKDWEVYEFLKPVFINGVGFCHYFPVGAMGRPASSASVLVNKLHMSCIAGHQQGKQNHRCANGHNIGFKQVGRHTSTIANVIADIVSDRRRVAGVILRNICFNLTHEVSADVRSLGKYTTAQTRKDRNQ